MILTDEPLKPRVRVFFWCLAIVLGGLHVWVYRNDLNPDSVSYIEMAEAAVGSGWHALVSAYWSPLYPALLSVGFRILRPSMYWEFTAVHVVNFVLYLADLLCFEFFLKELLAARRTEMTLALTLTQPLGKIIEVKLPVDAQRTVDKGGFFSKEQFA